MDTPTATRRWLLVVTTAAVVATTLCLRSAGYGHPSFIGSWSDDFYYYLRIAANWVSGNGLTFEGNMPTNGYQPLWQSLVTLGTLLFGADGLLTVMIFVVCAGTVATFLASRRVIAELVGSAGVVAILAALYCTTYFYMVAKHGMESILAAPLLMYFVVLILNGRLPGSSRRQLVATGALISLMVLTRIDSTIYIALLVPVWIASRGNDWRGAIRDGLYVALGCAPLLLYGLFNYVQFGALLPVSGQAKQLSGLHFPSPPLRGFEVSHRVHYVFIIPAAIVNIVALVLVVLRRGVIGSNARVALLPALLFPPFFYVVQTSLSDWPLWDWYLYPWIATTPLSLGVLLQTRRPLVEAADAYFDSLMGNAGKVCVGVAALGVLAIAARGWSSPRVESPILDFATALRNFAQDRPGRYAMGDRAGMVGFLLPQPLLQLEGLVGDRTFLQNIKQRRNLRDVLREHRIDYYATSSATKSGGCYYAVEPYQGGPRSPKMSGVFCEEPVMIHHAEYDGTTSVVFALRSLDGAPPAER